MSWFENIKITKKEGTKETYLLTAEFEGSLPSKWQIEGLVSDRVVSTIVNIAVEQYSKEISDSLDMPKIISEAHEKFKVKLAESIAKGLMDEK